MYSYQENCLVLTLDHPELTFQLVQEPFSKLRHCNIKKNVLLLLKAYEEPKNYTSEN